MGFFKALKTFAALAIVVLGIWWLWPMVQPFWEIGELPSPKQFMPTPEEVGRIYTITVADYKATADKPISIAAGEIHELTLSGKIRLIRLKDEKKVYISPCSDAARLVMILPERVVKMANGKTQKVKDEIPFSKSLLGKCRIEVRWTTPLIINHFVVKSQYKFEEKGGGLLWGKPEGYHAEGELFLTVLTEADKKEAERKASEAWEKKKVEIDEATRIAKEKAKEFGRKAKEVGKTLYGDTPKKVWDTLPKIKGDEELPPMTDYPEIKEGGKK